MINSKTNEIGEALKIGNNIKREINRQYNMLEIEVDGLFKPLLLLKKKKYACLKLDNLGEMMMNPMGQAVFKKEVKGLDMVRRDWCILSKSVSEFALDQILSGQSKDTVIEKISEYLQ
jgi:DNA polymerase alpha subunit A